MTVPYEVATNGTTPRIVSRPKVYEPRKAGLTASQIRWLEDTHKGISRNKFKPIERT